MGVGSVLMVFGLTISPVSALASTIASVSTTTTNFVNSGANDDVATFTIDFNIKASSDMFIPTSVALQSSMQATPEHAVLFSVAKSGEKIISTDGTALASATGVLIDNSVSQIVTCATMSCYYIPAGETHMFTLTVAISDAEAGVFRVSLVNIPTNDGTNDVFQNHLKYFNLNASDYTTDYIAMN